MSSDSQQKEGQNKIKLSPNTKKLLIRILMGVLKELLNHFAQNSDSSRPCPASPQDNPADG